MHENEFLQPAFLHQLDCSKKQPSLRPPFERRIPLSPNGLIDRRNTITLLISHFRTSGKLRKKTLQSNNVLLLCKGIPINVFIMTTRNKAILDSKKHCKHCKLHQVRSPLPFIISLATKVQLRLWIRHWQVGMFRAAPSNKNRSKRLCIHIAFF